MNQETSLSKLFTTFFKIGLFTFGGGYAMLAMIEDICVEDEHWINHDDMANITVIAESTPGSVAVNCATYVGYRQRHKMGAFVATVGVILPSFIIIYLISIFLANFLEIPIIAKAFKGIQIAVSLLIINAGIRMFKHSEKNPLALIMMGGCFVITIIANFYPINISTITLMIICATISLVVSSIKKWRGR